ALPIYDRFVIVEGAAPERARRLPVRLPLLPVALTQVEEDLGEARQRVGLLELGDGLAVFAEVVRGVPANERCPGVVGPGVLRLWRRRRPDGPRHGDQSEDGNDERAGDWQRTRRISPPHRR